MTSLESECNYYSISDISIKNNKNWIKMIEMTYRSWTKIVIIKLILNQNWWAQMFYKIQRF